MKSEEHISFRDLLIIGIGVLGAIWFFFDFPNHQPVSAARMNFNDAEVIKKSEDLLNDWNLQSVDLDKWVSFSSNTLVIDSLQLRDGRTATVSNLNNKEGLLPYFTWRINHQIKPVNKPEPRPRGQEIPVINAFGFEFSEGGDLVGFDLHHSIIRDQLPFNRDIIREAFLPGVNNQAKEDSLVSCLVDYQSEEAVGGSIFSSGSFSCFNDIGNSADISFPSQELIESVWATAGYYIERSFWKDFEMTRDTLLFEVENGIRYASSKYVLDNDRLGVSSTLTVDVLPAGTLKKMSLDMHSYDRVVFRDQQVQFFLLIVYALTLLIWLLIVFYLRIKAKIIDTRPALIVALLAGFLTPVAMIVGNLSSADFTTANLSFSFLSTIMLQIGITSAVSSMVFFTITAVGDSITRQFWAKKIETYDLIRRGFINNKPIGRGLVRGVSFGFALAGIFSLSYWIAGEAPVRSAIRSVSGIPVIEPIVSIFFSTLVAFGVCTILFQLIGSQFYASTKRVWFIPIISMVTFYLIMPPALVVESVLGRLIISGAVGFLLSLIYLRTDFLTTAVSCAVFFILMDSFGTWLISGSSEMVIFYIIVSILVVVFFLGIYAMFRGQEHHTIPSYIPEYMEEIAQEQRVRQELQIARNVQKSFLPTFIPKFEGLDLAGMCDPAMETGGDYFDIIKLDDTCAAIAIGDVSGKGIQAAFYMTFAKGVIHSLCTETKTATELLSKANRLFNDNATRGTFISMIYGILDAEKREFRYVRAGHNPILMKKTDGTTEWLQPKGVAIGMIKSNNYAQVVEEQCVNLDEVDSLILYTDGITEAMNVDNEFYGEERLEALLQKTNASTSNDLKDIIIKDVVEFIDSAEQHDDMTLVVIKAN